MQTIEKGEWTASQVLEGYIARVAIAQAETNCITEGEQVHHFVTISILIPLVTVLFEDARKQAKELDAEFASTGQLRGPLHGVPVSFKDQCTSLRVRTIRLLLLAMSQMRSRDTTRLLGLPPGPTNRPRQTPSYGSNKTSVHSIIHH